MNVIYPAIFHKEDEGYWVEFPDIAGCATERDNLPHAMEMAEEALSAVLSSVLDEGQTLPEASDIRSVDAGDGFVTYIKADPVRFMRRTKAVKKTLTIPQWLSDNAEHANLSLSAVLQEALLQRL